MAVGNNQNAAFYSISNGKICRQFKSPTANSVERVTKTGKTVHEEFYDFIDGRIVNIDTKDSDYGRFWMITLQDETGNYVLQMPYSSGYSAAFLKTLPNVDLSSSVKLIPKLTIEGDKKKTTLFVNQHGKALKFAFTKDEPRGLPELKKIRENPIQFCRCGSVFVLHPGACLLIAYRRKINIYIYQGVGRRQVCSFPSCNKLRVKYFIITVIKLHRVFR